MLAPYAAGAAAGGRAAMFAARAEGAGAESERQMPRRGKVGVSIPKKRDGDVSFIDWYK